MASQVPARGGEGAGDAEENDLLAGSQGVDGHLLEIVLLVEVGEGAVRQGISDCDGSHDLGLVLYGERRRASTGTANRRIAHYIIQGEPPRTCRDLSAGFDSVFGVRRVDF